MPGWHHQVVEAGGVDCSARGVNGAAAGIGDVDFEIIPSINGDGLRRADKCETVEGRKHGSAKPSDRGFGLWDIFSDCQLAACHAI